MIIGLLGNLGRGKTLAMTFILHLLKEETSINHIVTNYHTDITTDKIKSPQEFDDTSKDMKDRNEQGIYGIDEIWAWMDSRESMENDTMSNVVINSRKRGCITVYTTQGLHQVDKRLSDNTDFLGICHHYEAVETDYDVDVVKVKIFYKTELGEWIHVNTFVIDAEAYYNTYDTDEEIAKNSIKGEHGELISKKIMQKESGNYSTKKALTADLVVENGFSENKAEKITEYVFNNADGSNSTREERKKDGKDRDVQKKLFE